MTVHPLRAFAGAALAAASLLAAAPASAAATLTDTGAGLTNVLNTTGVLVASRSDIAADDGSSYFGLGIGFSDFMEFYINPGYVLTSVTVTSLGDEDTAQINYGAFAAYRNIGVFARIDETMGSLPLPTAGQSVGATLTLSGFSLGAGHYAFLVQGYGKTTLPTQGDAAYTVRLEGARVAVPEPATWAMLIAGFAAAGATLRQRRRTVAA